MKITKTQKIGNHFKKENIYLGILVSHKAKESSKVPELLYKSKNGFVYFDSEPKTIVGDGSDGNQMIYALIPIWEYYKEEQLEEVYIDNKFWAIAYNDEQGFKNYYDDYKDVKI